MPIPIHLQPAVSNMALKTVLFHKPITNVIDHLNDFCAITGTRDVTLHSVLFYIESLCDWLSFWSDEALLMLLFCILF